MTPELRIRLEDQIYFWNLVADYYNYKMTEFQLIMFSKDIERYSMIHIVEAWERYRTDPLPNKWKFPMPCQIISYIKIYKGSE